MSTRKRTGGSARWHGGLAIAAVFTDGRAARTGTGDERCVRLLGAASSPLPPERGTVWRMEGSIEARVSHEVELWLRWLPTWRPGTHRARTRLCRRCFGSPVIAAAGLVDDVPHAVQHSVSMRMKAIVDSAVDAYTDRNLPLLRRELRLIEQRRGSHGYRPNEGLDPAYNGLELDPEPVIGQPVLFTFAELSQAEPGEPSPRRSAPLSNEEKQALKQEIALADECAKQAGRRVCQELSEHRERMRHAIDSIVEPQVQALLADLESELDSPSWPPLA